MQPWSQALKNLIQRVINVFETRTPDGRYDALEVFADGIGDTRQITFGRSQTTEQGNLRKLVEIYIANQGGSPTGLNPSRQCLG